MNSPYVPTPHLHDLVNHPKVRPWIGPGSHETYIPKDWVCMREAGVGAVFHRAHWPGVWMGHHVVHPDFWGPMGFEISRSLLEIFALDYRPDRIIGWTDSKNRLACRYAEKLGFETDGTMQVRDTKLILHGKGYTWELKQQ